MPKKTFPEFSAEFKDSRPPEKVLHSATQGALHALQKIANNPAGEVTKFLDIGCGSGILAISAGNLWPNAHGIASDLSPLAVKETTTNLASTGLHTRIQVVRGEGYAHPLIHNSAPYDLIMSNLVAQLLIQYARDAKALIKPVGGMLIASGIQAWLEQDVLSAYEYVGFKVCGKEAIGDWRTITFQT